MNAVIEAILSRRSIRDYKPEQIKEEELELILKAGSYAPSAMNQQSWHFVVIQNEQTIERITAMLKRNPFYNAKTLVLAFGDRTAISPISDATLAIENMFLAAHSMGIGSCWINCVIDLFKTDEGRAFQKEIDIPENYISVGSFILGYPNKETEVQPRKEGRITYIK